MAETESLVSLDFSIEMFDLLFPLEATDIVLPQGELNENIVLRDREGILYVQRTPKRRLGILEDLTQEYTGIGFLTGGGSYSLRSPQEQFDFMLLCNEKNRPVLVPVLKQQEVLLSRYVVGERYSYFLGVESDEDVIAEVTTRYLGDIFETHQLGIVYGDRWGPNTIVGPDNEICHIDFDICLTGPIAAEFEMSQALYYTIFFCHNRQKALEICSSFIRENQLETIYDREMIKRLLLGHVDYFREGEYGGIEEEVNRLCLNL